jgi:beta-phosphoglucomutase-like phosphatase (HAD superfamily)
MGSPHPPNRIAPVIEAILFDAEGVVIDTEGTWDRAQVEFLGRRGLAYDRARIKPLLTGRSVAEGAAVMKQLFGLEGGVEALARERLAIVVEMVEDRTRFIAGFPEFFARVRPRFPTALATAMPAELLAAADRALGLSDLFEGRVSTLADVSGRSKPHPDLFLHAAGRLGVPPGRCLVIEDAPLGLEAARRAGMRTIGLATTYDRAALSGADAVADSFAEIDLARFER